MSLFPKSKTYTATGMVKSPMQFNHVLHEDGWYMHYSQGYQFVDAQGAPVDGIQKANAVIGEMPVAEIQANYPAIWDALVALWNFFDAQITAQESGK